jgi:hypothetical protein
MTSTFNINDNYSIDLSLNIHENHIYILIVNKTSNKSYEKQIINLENNLSNCVVNLVHHNATYVL